MNKLNSRKFTDILIKANMLDILGRGVTSMGCERGVYSLNVLDGFIGDALKAPVNISGVSDLADTYITERSLTQNAETTIRGFVARFYELCLDIESGQDLWPDNLEFSSENVLLLLRNLIAVDIGAPTRFAPDFRERKP